MKLGLQARLMGGLAVATASLVIAIGWAWTAREERDQGQALQARQARMVGLLERGLAGPIWNLDHITIDNLLDAAMADPEVHSLELTGLGLRGGVARRSRQEPAVEPLRRDFKISYQASADSTATEVAQGSLVYTRALVQQQVSHSRLFVAQMLAGVLLAVMVSGFVLIQRWVRRPVGELGRLAQRVADGELGAQARIAYRDEIGELTERFNAMSLRLRDADTDLRASEARYRSLFENATEGIFQTDAEGRVLSANGALLGLLGLREAPTGRTLAQLLGLAREEMADLSRVLAQEGRLQQVPLHLQLANGRSLWIELNAHWVTAEGEGAGQRRIEGMVIDITRRRQAEAELTRHRDNLEEVVAERTAELREATTRAEAANQAKGRFLATMSHEFRTPLNGILGFTQLLQMDSSLGPAQQSKLTLMRDSGEHLLALIADVLDMASVEAGKVIIKPTAVDLRALMEIAADSVRLRAEQKQLRFSLVLDPSLPVRVMLDGQRLRQVLLNLLSNAVKFTDHGEVGMSCRLLQREGASLDLRFEVRDTGVGMNSAQQARLFQAFEQVAENSRVLGGTGLGLSISQQLVKLMGGHITVGSAPGQGSCFAFELRAGVAE